MAVAVCVCVGSLVSPPLDVDGPVCVDFQYHMFGEDVETLMLITRIDAGTDVQHDLPLWAMSGNQGNQWRRYKQTHNLDLKGQQVSGCTYPETLALQRVGKMIL